MKGEETFASLLTDDERMARLQQLLGERFENRGKLSMPTTDTYNQLSDDDGLQKFTLDMFRWLGIKPRRLTVSYSNEVPAQRHARVDEHSIAIPLVYKQHPYMAAACAVFGVLRYVGQRYDHETNDTFIEFASIHTGLGLWVLNALRPSLHWHERMYHMIDGGWFRHEGITLSAYNPYQYGEHVAAYAHDNRVQAEDYVPGVSQHSRYALPQAVLRHSRRTLVEPHVVYQHSRAATVMWIKILLLAVTLALVTIIGVSIWAQRTQPITNEQLQAEYSIKVIKNAHAVCQQQALDQLSTNDPQDLFLARQVEATTSRCESLRNQYNYALDEYNQRYARQ